MTEINTQAVPANRRWRVARLTVTESGLALYTWAAMHTGSWAYKGFSTWQEAMDHADKQARTVEVTLPRQPLPLTLPGEEEDAPVVVTQAPEGDCFFLTDEDDGEMVALYPFELRPLALALLALHYQQEVNQ